VNKRPQAIAGRIAPAVLALNNAQFGFGQLSRQANRAGF
jgi:hypothetical protein